MKNHDVNPQPGSPPIDAPPQGGWPAWLLSFVLHLVAIVLLALLVPAIPRGAATEAERGVGIVLVERQAGKPDVYVGEQNDDRQSQQDAAASSQAQALPTPEQLPVDLAGALPTEISGLADAVRPGTGTQSADGFLDGPAPSRKFGGQPTSTSVFGVTGTGNRFVYVFDRSASMDGFQGRPLAAAKSQLIASLGSLGSIHQFQIIFYNNRITVFNPQHPNPPRMLAGDGATKRLAENFVRGIVADGRTRHMEALEMALGMRPDVIFFLTDAADPQLSPRELDQIRRRNQAIGCSIHAIEFGAGPFQGGTNFLVALARQNGGQHAYVDVTRLDP